MIGSRNASTNSTNSSSQDSINDTEELELKKINEDKAMEEVRENTIIDEENKKIEDDLIIHLKQLKKLLIN